MLERQSSSITRLLALQARSHLQINAQKPHCSLSRFSLPLTVYNCQSAYVVETTSICLFLCGCLYLFLLQSIYLSIYFSVAVCLSVCLSISISLYLSLFINLSIYLSISSQTTCRDTPCIPCSSYTALQFMETRH